MSDMEHTKASDEESIILIDDKDDAKEEENNSVEDNSYGSDDDEIMEEDDEEDVAERWVDAPEDFCPFYDKHKSAVVEDNILPEGTRRSRKPVHRYGEEDDEEVNKVLVDAGFDDELLEEVKAIEQQEMRETLLKAMEDDETLTLPEEVIQALINNTEIPMDLALAALENEGSDHDFASDNDMTDASDMSDDDDEDDDDEDDAEPLSLFMFKMDSKVGMLYFGVTPSGLTYDSDDFDGYETTDIMLKILDPVNINVWYMAETADELEHLYNCLVANDTTWQSAAEANPDLLTHMRTKFVKPKDKGLKKKIPGFKRGDVARFFNSETDDI